MQEPGFFHQLTLILQYLHGPSRLLPRKESKVRLKKWQLKKDGPMASLAAVSGDSAARCSGKGKSWGMAHVLFSHGL